MLVASFYDSAFSRQFAIRLRATAEALGLKCRIQDRSEQPSVPGKGGWRPLALLGLLEAYPADDVLLLEPDSVFNRRPSILLDERDYDVAVHQDTRSMTTHGPVFVRNHEGVRSLLQSWEEMNQSFPDVPELDNLSSALAHPRLPLEVRQLPVTYAWVERFHRERHPSAQPVITHFRTDNLITRRLKVR